MPDATAYTALAGTVATFQPPAPAVLNDLALLEAQRALAEVRRRVDAHAAAVAAEIAHRSRHELGYNGLAQRHGARTPQALVQGITGASKREAQTLVRVGILMAENLDPSPISTPSAAWMAAAMVAVRDARLTLDAAEVIRVGLGTPDETVSESALASAAARLVAEASHLSVERLAARARELRDELDEARIGIREAALRERRYLALTPQTDGMTRITGLLDPESAAVVVSAFDAVTSPRRGGPRFVDPTSADREKRLLRDERSTGQLALDSFVDLIRLGAEADGGEILGSHKPAVRILVSERDLARRGGAAHIEGQHSAVGIDTVDRHACEAGIVPILFDSDGQVINVGRDQRLFTRRQRVGLSARDGGCRFPGCDRPPSWTEAHHIDHWLRDDGRTDIADGVLLCRHHHLLVHNNGWRITRTGAEYFAIPPRSLDPEQRPIGAPPQRLLLHRTAS